ncbi:16S rRNA (guanine(966)-N(2))-methyltransferase RsmD [Paenibacillus xanthanilyticus]|uniref:16S rRNA (Guanine(966)-N(2))-methyltransferase RsmD n=1 Tax=Paenibacillus xanthanilyticus TaxID=1783531 RepID=A0ABV8KC93_9BACL
MRKGKQQVRVIAGTAKGRPLKAVPGSNTRPTTDKVKEAIFSMIGPYFDGGMVLDLFAGTGGLGIEALSRGMERAVFIDMERLSIEVIKQNVQAAGLTQQAEIYRNEAGRAIKVLEKRGERFALVFLDPPYRMKEMDAMMSELAQRGLLEDGARVIVEHDAAHVYPEQFASYIQLKHARYGDTAVTVYRHEPAAGETQTEEL